MADIRGLCTPAYFLYREVIALHARVLQGVRPVMFHFPPHLLRHENGPEVGQYVQAIQLAKVYQRRCWKNLRSSSATKMELETNVISPQSCQLSGIVPNAACINGTFCTANCNRVEITIAPMR